MGLIIYSKTEHPLPVGVWNTSLARMPTDVQLKISRFRRWEDAQASLLGRLLLNEGLRHLQLSQVTSNQVVYNSFGKPWLPNGPYFNISHSWPYVVCVIDHHAEVGIDIEGLRNIEPQEFKEQFTAEEMASIQVASDPVAAFFRYWSMKEAVVKAVGAGLSIDLKEINIQPVTASYGNQTFFLQEILLGTDCVCWVATEGIHMASYEVRQMILPP